MNDYYELLGVAKSSSKEEISKAYKKLASKWHPDKNLDNPEKASEMFKKIGRAYEILSDDEKRSIYDRFGEEGLTNGGPMPNAFNPFDLFGGMFGGIPRDPRETHQNDAKPIVHNIKCSLRDTYVGTKKSEHIERLIFCNGCNSTGFKDKKNHSCAACNGKGVQILVHQIGPGMIQQSTRTCVSCKGTGSDSNYPTCDKCNGQKKSIETIRIDIEIKKGTKKGHNYVIRGKGNQLTNESYSDIIIVFDVLNDPLYTRKGDDLYRTIDISLRKALLGFDMIVDHIDGKKIVISSSDVISPSKNNGIKVIPKLGFLSDHGTYGDYYIRFNVIFPDKFSEKQRKALDIVLHKDTETYDISKIDNLNHYKLSNTTINPEEVNDHEERDEPQHVQCAQQ